MVQAYLRRQVPHFCAFLVIYSQNQKASSLHSQGAPQSLLFPEKDPKVEEETEVKHEEPTLQLAEMPQDSTDAPEITSMEKQIDLSKSMETLKISSGADDKGVKTPSAVSDPGPAHGRSLGKQTIYICGLDGCDYESRNLGCMNRHQKTTKKHRGPD